MFVHLCDVYTCSYILVYVRMCVSVCMYMCTYNVHVCTCICVHTMYMCVHVYVYIQCTCVYMYMCTYNVHVCTCICVHTMYMCVHVYVYIQCTCVYMCLQVVDVVIIYINIIHFSLYSSTGAINETRLQVRLEWLFEACVHGDVCRHVHLVYPPTYMPVCTRHTGSCRLFFGLMEAKLVVVKTHLSPH